MDENNMDENKDIGIGSLLEAIPGILLGFSIGSIFLVVFFSALIEGGQYPYESLASSYIIYFDILIGSFMTAFIVIKLFWMKQKKWYLCKMFMMLFVGAICGFMVTLILIGYGSENLANSMWGL